MTFPTSFKRALVVAANQLDQYKFFETVSVNHTQLVKVFTDMDEAKAWLLAK